MVSKKHSDKEDSDSEDHRNEPHGLHTPPPLSHISPVSFMDLIIIPFMSLEIPEGWFILSNGMALGVEPSSLVL